MLHIITANTRVLGSVFGDLTLSYMKPILSFLCALVVILLTAAPGARAQSPMGNALSFGGNAASQYVVVSNFGNIIPTKEITVTEHFG